MRKDVLDHLEGCLGCVPLRAVLLVAAVWIGCTIAAWGLLVGFLVGKQAIEDWMILMLGFGPMLLFGELVCLNLFLFLLGMILFWKIENLGCRFWGIFTGVQAILAMGGLMGEMNGPVPVIAAWTTLICLLVMMGVALWFFRQWWFNRWAVELALLRSENAARLADREARKNENNKKGAPPEGDAPL